MWTEGEQNVSEGDQCAVVAAGQQTQLDNPICFQLIDNIFVVSEVKAELFVAIFWVTRKELGYKKKRLASKSIADIKRDIGA